MKHIAILIAIGIVLTVALAIWRGSTRLSGGSPSESSDSLVTLDTVTEWLTARGLAPVRPYSTFDFGREQDTQNLSIVLSEEKAEQVLPQLRDELGPGLIAFIGTTRWLGDEQHAGVELVIAPGQTQFDILRAARSDAVNYDIDTDKLIDRLRDLHERFGIDIFQAESDTVQLRFLSVPEQPLTLAQELYEFCPDIVDQGCGSVDALAQSIREDNSVYLWWD